LGNDVLQHYLINYCFLSLVHVSTKSAHLVARGGDTLGTTRTFLNKTKIASHSLLEHRLMMSRISAKSFKLNCKPLMEGIRPRFRYAHGVYDIEMYGDA
jgi:hypothetical protein